MSAGSAGARLRGDDADTPPPVVALAYASGGAPSHDPEDHDLAVSSVLCGLLACVPFMTGILSLCFGIAVLRHARGLRPLDLALAVIGVTLGGLNVAVWILFVAGPLYG